MPERPKGILRLLLISRFMKPLS